MSNLTRYSLRNVAWGDGDCHTMVESSVGEYVKFDDIKDLLPTANNSASKPCQYVKDRSIADRDYNICAHPDVDLW